MCLMPVSAAFFSILGVAALLAGILALQPAYLEVEIEDLVVQTGTLGFHRPALSLPTL